MGETGKRLRLAVAWDADGRHTDDAARRPKTLGRAPLIAPRALHVTVRPRDVVDTSGGVERSFDVFCPRDRRSLDRETCSDCREYRGSGDGDASVACMAQPAVGGDGAQSLSSLAASIPVGMAMDGIRCLTIDTLLTTAMFDAHAGPLVVVGESGVPLGVVRSEVKDLLPAHAQAGDLMVPVRTVTETDTLSAVLSLMLQSRARYVVVVDHERAATGLISDVIALRWLTHRLRA